ncbi:hypothetical protein ACLESO_24360, partial [Pyxidicoccus sp. 3LG]
AFTSSGDASGEASLARLPAQPHPAVTAGACGSTLVLSGQQGALPLMLIGLTGQGASSSSCSTTRRCSRAFRLARR